MRKQRGITLIAAMFVVIIVALLGQYLVKISGVQNQISTMALQSARAYQTANAGIEWGIANIDDCKTLAAGASTAEPSFSVNNFSIDVTFLSDNGNIHSVPPDNVFNENGDAIHICHITSKSEFGIYNDERTDYVSRTLRVTIHD